MSDIYLAENAEGDLTVWLVMPSGEDRAILSRQDLNMVRPMGMGRMTAEQVADFDAVTIAHDELWAKITDELVNYDTAVWLSGDEAWNDLCDSDENGWSIDRADLDHDGDCWHLLSGFDPADFTDPDLADRKEAVV